MTLYDEIKKFAGDDIAWFDKRILLPGDQWRQQVDDAIEGCRLFLPVISRSGEERTEGEFLREWHTAVDRWARIEGRTSSCPCAWTPTPAPRQSAKQARQPAVWQKRLWFRAQRRGVGSAPRRAEARAETVARLKVTRRWPPRLRRRRRCSTRKIRGRVLFVTMKPARVSFKGRDREIAAMAQSA